MKFNFQFENKNIIILLKSFVLGGAEKQALFLASHLQNQLECKVYIYSYIKIKSSELFYKECEKYNLTNLFIIENPLSAAGKLKYLKRRIKIGLLGLKLRKHQPDIIIPYLNPPSIIANICYKIAGAKTTFWHHRGPDYYRDDTIESTAVRKTKTFIANSPDGKKELEKQFNLPKVYFVPNFSTILEKEFLAKPKKPSYLEGKIVIGMIGHFRQEKLQSILVEAFSNLLKEIETIHLVLVGNIHENKNERSSYSDVEALIKSNNLENSVSILHNTNSKEVLDYLDIGALISIKEGMPNIVMEYMAYRLPILTTNHEGCIELLGEDYDFYTENETRQVEKKLRNLVENEKLRKSLGKRNQELLNSKFSIENYIVKLEEILSN